MLQFTGERFLPEVEGQIELEHLHRYLIARRLVKGKLVLDIASGEGYGSALLAAQAKSVTGVDISRDAVDHARSRYASLSNLRFLVGDCADIPMKAASVDVVVSFETIEHHERHEEMLAEIKRVLRPGGLLVMSSPDRYNYSVATGYNNEYHVKELYRHEFEALLSRHFNNTSLLGQRVAYGSMVLPEGRGGFVSFRKSGAAVEESAGIVAPVYLIAVASDNTLPRLEGSVFDSPLEQSDLLVEMQRRLAERDGQVVGLTDAMAARDVEVAELRGKVEGLSDALALREEELVRERSALQLRNDSYIELEGVVSQLRQEIANLNGAVTLLQAAIGDRVRERDVALGSLAVLQHALESRDLELSALRSRNAAAAELEGKLAALTQVAESQASELQSRREQAAAVAKDVADLKERLGVTSKRLEAQSGLLEAARASEVLVSELQGKLAAVIQRAEVLSVEVQTRTRQAEALVDAQARISATLTTLESTRQELADERARVAQMRFEAVGKADRARAELAELRRVVDERKAASAELHRLIEAERRATAALKADLAEREATLAQTRVVLEEERGGRQAAQDKLFRIEAQLEQVNQRSAAEAVRHQEFTSRHRSEVERLAGQCEHLVHQLAARDAEVLALGARIEEIEADRIRQAETIAALQVRALSLQHQVVEMEVMIGNHRKIIQQIWSSRSWRLTKGLRFAGRLMRGDWADSLASLRRYLSLVGSAPTIPPAPLSSGATTAAAPAPTPLPAGVSPVGRITPDQDVSPTDLAHAADQPSSALVQAAGEKCRILLVSYYCPSRSHAGGLRILDLYALIRRKAPGVELHLYTHQRPSIDWFEDEVSTIFDRVHWSPTEELTAAGLTAIAGKPLYFDVIDLQFHQAAYDIDAYRRMGRTLLFTPMESLARFSFLQARSAFLSTGRFPLRELARGFRAVAEEVVFSFKVDKVVCVSRSDAAFLRAVTYLRRIQSLETGVSEIEFPVAGAGGKMRDLASAGQTLLFVAYFGSQTNVDALRWYLDEVHPRVLARVPAYRFVVVGRGDLSSFDRYVGPAVELVGEVPRIAPFIESARVGIAPALGGSGFRGKVNQYALFGVPTVVSPISAKGLAYQTGKDILIGRSAEEFAEHCIALLLDDALNITIGTRAHATCAAKYTWDSKWPAVARLYELNAIA